MGKYYAQIHWSKGEAEPFLDNKYSRAHSWHFDGGVTVPASSSPHVVPVPMSVEANVDPEEAFVASLSSCHMLWFLHLAAEAGVGVLDYNDHAEGVMARNEEKKLAMTQVTLKPQVSFMAPVPSTEKIAELHHVAHEKCFIANSVKTEVLVEPIAVNEAVS